MVYESSKSGEVTKYHGSLPEEVLAAIERADEEEIVQHLSDVNAQSYFAYAYPIKTKDGEKMVIGISTDGAKEIARMLGNIKVASSTIQVSERDGYFYCVIEATDLLRNVTLPGVGRNSKYILGDGNVPTDRLDETAFVKSVSKASRNGILNIAPQKAVADIVAKLDPKLVRRLPGPPSSTALLPSQTKPAARGGRKPAEAPTGGQASEELTKLKQQIIFAWNDTGLNEDARHAWVKRTYSVESMNDLDKKNLDDMLVKVKTMQLLAKELGFANVAEQEGARLELFRALKAAGHATAEQQKEYLTTRQIGDTRSLKKPDLEKLIADIKLASEGEGIPSDI